MNKIKPWKIGIITGVVICLVAAAISIANRDDEPKPTSKINVVASYYPLYDFAKNVGGDKVVVTNITPAGSEPHDFEPSPQQLVEANKSDVFVYSGGTMEPWVDKFVTDYKNVNVKASNGVSLMEGTDEETGEPSSDVLDPHFWLDPSLAQVIVNNIRDGLIKADEQNKDYYTQQAKAYTDKLVALDQEYKKGLAQCEIRTAVSSHDAFSYLAKRYNLDIVSIAGISPEEEPSAATLAEITELVKEKQIKYIFFESLVSPELAETVANETGAQTAVFDPIEGLSDEDQQQGKDYLSIQRENLQNLRTALACQ